MSVELAKAFCVRLMSDDEFRDAIGRAASAKEIADLVRGGLTVGQAVDKIYDKNATGHSEGAIGLLSKGIMDRKELTKQSVLAAMIPRL